MLISPGAILFYIEIIVVQNEFLESYTYTNVNDGTR